MRNTLIAAAWLLLAGIAAPPVLAQPAAPGGEPIGSAPQEIVRRGVDRLAGFLIGAQRPGPSLVRKFLEREIAPHFDFAYMARWAAGPYSRRMDASAQAAMTGRLRALFLGALARNLGSFSGSLPQVRVYPARPGRNRGESVVDARVDAGPWKVNLAFRFYRASDGWKVFDVAANGISAVAYYRRYFSTLLRRYGPRALFN